MKHKTHPCKQEFDDYVFQPGTCPLCPVDSENCKCGSCGECQDFETEKGFYIPKYVFLHVGEDWIKEHIYRNIKYDHDKFHSRQWDIFITEKHLE